jgi:hypothetical protein
MLALLIALYCDTPGITGRGAQDVFKLAALPSAHGVRSRCQDLTGEKSVCARLRRFLLIFRKFLAFGTAISKHIIHVEDMLGVLHGSHSCFMFQSLRTFASI